MKRTHIRGSAQRVKQKNVALPQKRRLKQNNAAPSKKKKRVTVIKAKRVETKRPKKRVKLKAKRVRTVVKAKYGGLIKNPKSSRK